jgi:LysR family transcriptional regulator, hydrogen peroxide-inducible genes activator
LDAPDNSPRKNVVQEGKNNDVKLVQLRYVKSVATTGSFSMSARICGVSQPTISNAISDLESELRAKIFNRTTRCVELTPFGTRILNYIDCILNRTEDIKHEAEACMWPAQKLLHVAFSPIIDGPRVMAAFEMFQTRCPEIAFVYRECVATEMEACLGQEKLDVACGIRIHDSPTLNRCVLYRDALRFLPRGGLKSYRGPRTLSLAEIAREILIFPVDACGFAPAVRELFQGENLELRAYPGHPLSYRVIQEWSSEGLAAALLPESRIEGDSESYPMVVLRDQPVQIAVEAVWSRANRNPHAKAFATFLRDLAASGALRRGRLLPRLPKPPLVVPAAAHFPATLVPSR